MIGQPWRCALDAFSFLHIIERFYWTYHWVDLELCSSSFVCIFSPGTQVCVQSLARLPSKLCASLPSAPSSSPDTEIGWWSLVWRALKPPGWGGGTVRVALVGLNSWSYGIEFKSSLKPSLIYWLTSEKLSSQPWYKPGGINTTEVWCLALVEMKVRA